MDGYQKSWLRADDKILIHSTGNTEYTWTGGRAFANAAVLPNEAMTVLDVELRTILYSSVITRVFLLNYPRQVTIHPCCHSLVVLPWKP